MEADLQCSNAIHSMEKRLRAACNASDAKIDNVAKVIGVGLILDPGFTCCIVMFAFWLLYSSKTDLQFLHVIEEISLSDAFIHCVGCIVSFYY